jgi:o-succinylbenzoate synthase
MTSLAPAGARVREHCGSMSREVWSARGAWSERRGLILELEITAGIVGVGEASPLPGYAGDDFNTARAELEAFCAGSLPPLELDAPVEWARALALQLDAIAKSIGCGMAALFEASAGAATATSLIALFDPQPSLSRALERGITSFKCKLGRPGEFDRELEALGRLHNSLPTSAILRVDVNGAWSPDEAPNKLLAVADRGATLVEQPCPPSKMARLAPSPVAIAVDESLASGTVGEELAPLVARGQIAAFVIKPAVVGGLATAWDLVQAADDAGVVPIISHLLDGPIALAACAELAVATNASLPAGLDRHQGLSAWPTSSIPQFVGGQIRTCGKGIGDFA